jgi:hypothetical protein
MITFLVLLESSLFYDMLVVVVVVVAVVAVAVAVCCGKQFPDAEEADFCIWVVESKQIRRIFMKTFFSVLKHY